MTKVGSESVRNEGTFLVLPGDAVSGAVVGRDIRLPRRRHRGVSTLDGCSRDRAGKRGQRRIGPLTFWVRPASSQISRVTAVSVHEGTRVRGRATAGDSMDKSAATGVEIRFAKNRRWGALYCATVTDGRLTRWSHSRSPVERA